MEIIAILFSLCGLCLVPLLVIGIFAFVLYTFRKEAGKQEAIWGDVAAQMGLSYTPGSFFKRPSAAGTWHGRALRLFTTVSGTPGSGSSTTYTVITLSLNNLKSITLTMSEESLFRQVASLMLGENVQIGVEAFDKRFRIQCNPPEAAPAIFLQNNLHIRLLQTRSLRITVNGGELRYQHVNVETDKNHLLFLFDLLDDLAAAVERA